MRKLEYEAADKKNGLTLAELKQAVEEFEAIAKINDTNLSSSKVRVMINMSGGIKTITAEV